MTKKLVLAFLLAAALCSGQEKTTGAPAKYYRLDFTVKELESGKVVNSRSYSLSVTTTDSGASNGAVRAGEKIPVRILPNTFQNYDVGVNLDCRQVKEVGDRLMLNLSSDVSYLVAGDKDLSPIVRQNKWSGYALIPIKKSALVFSSDDPASKGTLQLDVIATPLN